MSDEDQGAVLRDAGIAAADGAAPEEWKSAVEDILRGFCAEPDKTFTADAPISVISGCPGRSRFVRRIVAPSTLEC